jgi:hypothetical protein
MSDRPTPETDDRAFHRDSGEYGMVDYVVDADFARRLERQRDELLDALENIAKQKILDEVEDPVCCDFEDGYTTCVEVARAAIAAVKGGQRE